MMNYVSIQASKNTPSRFRDFLLILLFLNLFQFVFAQNGEIDLLDEPDTVEVVAPLPNTRIVGYRDAEVRERLGYLSGCLSLEYNNSVRGYLNTYIYRKTEKTEKILSRRLTYFPIFEQKLKEHNLPADLKYLSVVESALDPKAISRAGAGGLWQFMPKTGNEYGLRQNGQVDERSDPVKSTEAAMQYLKKLYNQFDDWALALAAYNSGPTRVTNAIKRAHSRNFWRIQRYLPAETANYVPAFIAATYICNYFQMHNFQFDDPDLDLQLTSYLKIWEGLSFRSIADATGIDYQVVKQLNPGYKRDYIPSTMEGHYVVLPSRVMPAFTNYLNSVSSQRTYINDLAFSYASDEEGSTDGRYAQIYYKIENTDHVDHIGAAIGVNGDQLKTWNRLENNWVSAGQMVKVWRPVVIQKHATLRNDIPLPTPKPTKKMETLAPPPAKKPEERTQQKPQEPVIQKETAPSSVSKTTIWHTVRRNESLDDIARKYNVAPETIKELNKFDTLKIGMRLKIQ